MTPLLALLIAAAAPQGVDDAERAYREGRVAEARELYAARLERARSARGRGTLEFNLGNCAYRLGRPAEALAWYRRARLRLPDDPDATANERLAARALGSAFEGESVGGEAPPGWASAIAAAGATALGLGAALLLRMRAARLAGLVVACAALAFGARHALRADGADGVPAVVVAPEIVLRAEPHRESAAGLKLAAGETVRILERSDRWARVEHPRGGGWVEPDRLLAVE